MARRAIPPAVAFAAVAAVGALLALLPPEPEDRAGPGDEGMSGVSAAGARPARAAGGFAVANADGGTVRREALVEEPGPLPPPEFARALAAFRGRVLLPDGEPASGAEVALLQLDPQAWIEQAPAPEAAGTRAPDLLAGTATADASGRFHIAGAWPRGMFVVRAALGAALVASDRLAPTPAPGATVDVGDLYLHVRAGVEGTVLDARGAPVAGALVRAVVLPEHLLRAWPIERFDPDMPILCVDGDRSHVLALPAWIAARLPELGVASTRTDAGGRFRFDGVPPGQATLLVHGEGHVPRMHPASDALPGSVTDVGTIVLERGLTVHGVVCEADGTTPIPGAEVLVGQGTALVRYVFPVRAGPTDAQGAFAASGFTRGEVVAAARRAPDEPWVVGTPQRVDDKIALRIPGAYTLSLVVRSATGLAVEPAVVLVPAAGDGEDDLDRVRFGLRTPLSLRGRLTRHGDRCVIRPLQGGRWLLRIAASGHYPFTQVLTVDRDRELVVELQAETPCTVLVTDDGGNPIEGAVITLQALGTHPGMPRLPVPCGRTARDGTLSIRDAPAARVAVRASHPAYGFGEREVELPAMVVPLRLGAPGAIEGVLTAGRRPVEPDAWRLALRLVEPPSAEPLPVPKLVEPGADGRFIAAGLRPGTWEVSAVEAAEAPGPEVLLDARALARTFRAPERVVRVAVYSGRTSRVRLDLDALDPTGEPGARVSGRVEVRGRPATGLEVRGWHRRWLASRVGPEGTFDLGVVPEGDVGLYVVDPDAVREGRWEVLWWQSVPVRAGRDVDLTIMLAVGAIAGEVRRADGEPVGGCEVKATGAFGEGGARTKLYAVADRDGRFRFATVPEGVYEVTVWDPRHGRATRGDVTVEAGRTTSGVVLDLLRVVTVRGRVVLDALGRQRPQWCWLRLYGVDADGRYGSSERGCRVRADGTFALEGVPRGRYEVSIGAMFTVPGAPTGFETLMFVHDELLDVGTDDLDGVILRPRPRGAVRAAK